MAQVRDVSITGAHFAGHNTGTIGISLFGGHGSSETDQFEDNFTPAQETALRALIADLQGQYGKVPVTGHNQYAAKACPGFSVPAWLSRAPLAIDTPDPVGPEPQPNGLAALFAAFLALFKKG